MGDIFKALSSGFARFAFAWMAPSLVSVGLFTIFVLPGIDDSWILKPVTDPADSSSLAGAAIFAFAVVVLSVSFAYASLPIYQVLEGYRLPRILKRRLRKRHLRRYAELRQVERIFRQTGGLPHGYTTDDLWMRYPRDISQIRPTMLGNALTSMEQWSIPRYGLDSQTLWYELLAVSSETTRKNVDEGRAPVDFYVSSIIHLLLLSLAAIPVGIFTSNHQALAVGLGAALAVPLSYKGAVLNVMDYAQSVKAMINVERSKLAASMSLQLPHDLQQERNMWSAHLHVIELANDAYMAAYDAFRMTAQPDITKEDGQAKPI